jgi:hypothetical protein
MHWKAEILSVALYVFEITVLRIIFFSQIERAC